MLTPTPSQVPVVRAMTRPAARSEPTSEVRRQSRPVRVYRSLVLRPDEYLAIVAAGRGGR